MLGNSSGDRPWVGLGGSGGLSHVYIQYPPLRCNIPETQGLYYDDGNKLLLSPSSGQVLSWKVSPLSLSDPPNSDSISEGPVLSIRYSLDRKAIGIQRSNHEIQFKNRETGETFSQRYRSDSESILGFFWTDCPSTDIIIIKTSGIDMLSYEPELNTLRLVEGKRFSVSWYVYTHESRLVLLASGMQCTILSGFQFSAGGIIRLPKFEMTMTKIEANQKPVLAADDVHIVTVYGRIYCLQLDNAGMLLNLYRFYRDAVVQQGTVPVYSRKIRVSAVDNVILIHQVDAKVVILYDIFLDSLLPVSAPLPLLLRGQSSNNKQMAHAADNPASAYGGMIYSDSWTFLVPDLICDVDNGFLWKICLDLEAIAASSSDVPSVLEFLQRRRSDPNMIKSLCLAIMRTIILERRPMSMLSKAIDVLVASYSHSVKTGSTLQGRATENIQHSGSEQLCSSTKPCVESKSGTLNHEKSMRQESSSGAESESQQLIDRRNDSLDRIATPGSITTSGLVVFDSEGHLNLENMNVDSRESPHTLSSGSQETSENVQVVTKNKAQSSNTHPERAQLQSEVPGQDNSSLGSCISVQQGTLFSTVAISPDDIYQFVFAPVEDEMGSDPAYLIAVIVEFLRSVSKEKIKVQPNVYVMTIQLLARNNRYAELGLFVIHKILEPSKEVALQLLDSGRQNLQTRKLGVDMLRQLSLHHDYVTAFLQDGYYLEALRYARKNKVITVSPSLFLEAAVAASNSQHLAAVLRFVSDFTPGFNDTSEHSRYQRILTEMC